MAKGLESLKLGHCFGFIDELIDLGAKAATFVWPSVLHEIKGVIRV